MSSNKAEVAIDVAVKRAQLRSLHSLQAQERKFREEEDKLAILRAQADVDAVVARAEAYGMLEDRYHTPCGSVFLRQQEYQTPHLNGESWPKPVEVPGNGPRYLNPPASSNISAMLDAFRESVCIGRLPVPEPPVFQGDPMRFPDWKNQFIKLIEGRSMGAADKLFYLRKYTAGPAAKAIQGAFLRTDEAAYQDAWKKLNSRYGGPFLTLRTYREKIAKWPKVGEKDSQGLQDLADFLDTCNDAIPFVKGLEVLNDCEENRKMVAKLPESVSRRWNRRVANALKNAKYPTFKEFCDFLIEEAEVVCNPFTNPGATSTVGTADKDG